MSSPVVRIHHVDGRAVRVTTRDADGVTTEHPADHVISSMPFTGARQGDGPAGTPTTCGPLRRSLEFHDFLVDRAGRAGRQGHLDRQLDLHPHPRGRRCGSRTSARGRRTWSRKAARARPGVHRCRGRRVVDRSGRRPDPPRCRGARGAGADEPDAVEAGYVVRMPKAYPIYDDDYNGNLDTLRGWVEDGTQHPSRGPQRHAPLQQPGSLDVHGHAHGRQHLSRGAPRHLVGQRQGGLPRRGESRAKTGAPTGTGRSAPLLPKTPSSTG